MISLIVAVDKNNAIGINNSIPWHLPNDLRWFKKNTIGKTIVMGYQTWLSLKQKPLVNRKNIVLSRNKNLKIENAELVHNFKEVLIRKDAEICIIGGAQIYQLYLPFVEKIYLTRVLAEFEADTFLKNLDLTSYQLEFEQFNSANKEGKTKNQGKNLPDYRFQVYQRKL